MSTSQKIINPDGSTATIAIDYTYTPAPALPKMLIGTDNLAAPIKGATFGRYYCPPGAGFKAPASPIGTPMISVKDDPGTTAVADQIKAYAQARAKAGQRWFVDYDHEPEGDSSRQLYQDRTVSLADLVDEYGGGYALQVETFTLYAQLHGKNGPDGLDTKSEDMWTGRAPYLGVDGYQEHQLAYYTDPATMFARPLQILANVRANGLLIPELGVQPIAADSTGHGAGMAYAGHLEYLADHGCVAVGLWGQGGCVLTPVQLAYVTAAMTRLAA